MTYTPRVHDYVKWHHNGNVDEGWVYFKGDEYLTIEVSVKDKPDELVHWLVVCHHWYWNELEYVKNRRGEEDSYKSQEHRYADVQ